MLDHSENTCPWQYNNFPYGKSKATFCTSWQCHLQGLHSKFIYPSFPIILTATGKIQVSPTVCIFQLFRLILMQSQKHIFLQAGVNTLEGCIWPMVKFLIFALLPIIDLWLAWTLYPFVEDNLIKIITIRKRYFDRRNYMCIGCIVNVGPENTGITAETIQNII